MWWSALKALLTVGFDEQALTRVFYSIKRRVQESPVLGDEEKRVMVESMRDVLEDPDMGLRAKKFVTLIMAATHMHIILGQERKVEEASHAFMRGFKKLQKKYGVNNAEMITKVRELAAKYGIEEIEEEENED